LAAKTAAAGNVADSRVSVEIEHYVLSGRALDIDLGFCEEEWHWLDE